MRRLSVLLVPALLLAACGGTPTAPNGTSAPATLTAPSGTSAPATLTAPNGTSAPATPTAVALQPAVTSVPDESAPAVSALPFLAGPTALDDDPTYHFVSDKAIPADFDATTIPPATTAGALAHYAGDKTGARADQAIFATTATEMELVRYYTGFAIAHGGSFNVEGQTGEAYGDVGKLSLYVYAPDVTLAVWISPGYVAFPVKADLVPDWIYPQVAYPKDLPAGFLPAHVLTMDNGGIDNSLQIWTIETQKSFKTRIAATYKQVKATQVRHEDNKDGGIYRGLVSKAHVLEVYYAFHGPLVMMQIQIYEDENYPN